MTFTLAANTQQTRRMPGRILILLAATAGFAVEIENRPRKTLSMSGVRKIVEVEEFVSVTFIETNGANNTINVEYGFADLELTQNSGDVQATVKNAPTYPKSTGLVSIPDGESVTYTGLHGANERKSFCVANREVPTGVLATDFAKVLDVGTSDAPVGIPLFPGEKITLDTGGEIIVTNDSGGAINHSAFEIFNQS